MRSNRLFEFIAILGAVAVLAILFIRPDQSIGEPSVAMEKPRQPERLKPTRTQTEPLTDLSVSGLRPGMTYDDVLAVAGLPYEIRFHQGETYFTYPYPRASGCGAEYIWTQQVRFSGGHVIYCEGAVLQSGSKEVVSLDSASMVDELENRLGPATQVSTRALCWPEAGVVVRAYQVLDDDLLFLGLQSKNEKELGARPWMNGDLESFRIDGVVLGDENQPPRARHGPSVETAPGGYVWKVSGRTLDYGWQTNGERREATIQVGDSREGEKDGWASPHPNIRLLVKGGKIREVKLHANNQELYRALERYCKTNARN